MSEPDQTNVIEHLRSEIAATRADLATKASMLARQTDLAREAENKLADARRAAEKAGNERDEARLRVGVTTEKAIRDSDALARLSQELRTLDLRGGQDIGAVDAALVAIDRLAQERNDLKTRMECAEWARDEALAELRQRDNPTVYTVEDAKPLYQGKTYVRQSLLDHAQAEREEAKGRVASFRTENARLTNLCLADARRNRRLTEERDDALEEVKRLAHHLAHPYLYHPALPRPTKPQKTALDRFIHLKKDSGALSANKYLDAIPVDAPEQLDLQRDEFRRIMACPGADKEIIGLCERAAIHILQHVPVLEQRDVACCERDQAQAERDQFKASFLETGKSLGKCADDNARLREKLAAAECLLGEAERGAVQVNADLRRGREIEAELGLAKAKLAAIERVADPKDSRPADEQLEDLLGYMDVLTHAIDAAGVGDEARALDEPRAVAEAIDILAQRQCDAVEEIAALRKKLAAAMAAAAFDGADCPRNPDDPKDWQHFLEWLNAAAGIAKGIRSQSF